MKTQTYLIRNGFPDNAEYLYHVLCVQNLGYHRFSIGFALIKPFYALCVLQIYTYLISFY